MKRMYYTYDPVADFNRYDADRQRELDRLPICAECGHPITDEHLFEINGVLICEECLNDNYRKNTEDFIE